MYLSRIGKFDQALSVLNEALVLAPGKQSLMTQVAITEFTHGDPAKAIELMRQAYESEKTNKEVLSIYVAILIYTKQGDLIDKTIAEGLANNVDVSVDPRVLQAFLDTKDFARLVATAKKAIEGKPKDPQVHISAAAIYLKAGDRAAAIKELQIAASLAPEFKAQSDKYIEIIRKGGDPTAAPAATAAKQG